jgi:hypothetical protein
LAPAVAELVPVVQVAQVARVAVTQLVALAPAALVVVSLQVVTVAETSAVMGQQVGQAD